MCFETSSGLHECIDWARSWLVSVHNVLEGLGRIMSSNTITTTQTWCSSISSDGGSPDNHKMAGPKPPNILILWNRANRPQYEQLFQIRSHLSPYKISDHGGPIPPLFALRTCSPSLRAATSCCCCSGLRSSSSDMPGTSGSWVQRNEARRGVPVRSNRVGASQGSISMVKHMEYGI